MGFGGCLIGAAVCFFVSFLTLPMIALRPSKFALSFRCVAIVSLFTAMPLQLHAVWDRYWSCSGTSARPLHLPLPTKLRRSFSVLIGPLNHIKHLISRERLPFSFAYLTSLGLTLYFSLGVRCFSCYVSSMANTLPLHYKAHSYLGSLLSAIVQVRPSSSHFLAPMSPTQHLHAPPSDYSHCSPHHPTQTYPQLTPPNRSSP